MKVSKGTLHFKYVHREWTEQTKTNEEVEIKEESFHLLIHSYFVCYNHSSKGAWVVIKYSILMI